MKTAFPVNSLQYKRSRQKVSLDTKVIDFKRKKYLSSFSFSNFVPATAWFVLKPVHILIMAEYISKDSYFMVQIICIAEQAGVLYDMTRQLNKGLLNGKLTTTLFSHFVHWYRKFNKVDLLVILLLQK